MIFCLPAVEIIIMATEPFAEGLIVFGELQKGLVESCFVKKTLLNKIISHLFLLAALIKEEGSYLKLVEQAELFCPFTKLVNAAAIVDDLMDIFSTQPSPAFGYFTQRGSMLSLPGYCSDDRIKWDDSQIVKKQAKL